MRRRPQVRPHDFFGIARGERIMERIEGAIPATEGPILEHRVRPGLELRTASGRFPIIDLRHDTCLIENRGHLQLRGYADIYEGENQKARCLIVLVEPDGDFVRCGFKHNTPARSTPPVDFPL
jgi:hypothetical protein